MQLWVNDQDRSIIMDQEKTLFISKANFAQFNKCFEAAGVAINHTDDVIKKSHPELESFLLIRDELQKAPPGYQGPELDSLNFLLLEKGNILIQHLSIIVNELHTTVGLCSNVIAALIRELNTQLDDWKKNQRLAGNGCSHFNPNDLNYVQLWCDSTVEIACTNLNQIKEAKRLTAILTECFGQSKFDGHIKTLLNLSSQFTSSLSALINTTFIITEQPPQVMKTNTRFSAQVRSLVGKKLQEYTNLAQVQVTVSIINETQANLLVSEKKFPCVNIGEISNNVIAMNHDQPLNQFITTFRNMKLEKVKRAEKKGSESVVDEKFALLFRANFKINGEINILASTISLPVTVIVHGNQESHAYATIMWDNAFSKPSRKLFAVPDKASWSQVAKALDMKYASVTGKSLTTDNMNYIAEKLFGPRLLCGNYDSMELSRSKFCKETLPGRSFTFWDWFYAIMKLTKEEHLKKLWVNGVILGFVSKIHTEQMLRSCQDGTFLLRFSDSELGGISVACVTTNDAGQKIVTMVQPYTSKELSMRSLPDRLYDATNLLYVYPNIPKHRAFGKCDTDTKSSPTEDPYAKRIIHEVIVGISKNLPPIPSVAETPHNGSNTLISTYQSNSPNDLVSNSSDNHSFCGTNDVGFSDQMGDSMDIPYNDLVGAIIQRIHSSDT